MEAAAAQGCRSCGCEITAAAFLFLKDRSRTCFRAPRPRKPELRALDSRGKLSLPPPLSLPLSLCPPLLLSLRIFFKTKAPRRSLTRARVPAEEAVLFLPALGSARRRETGCWSARSTTNEEKSRQKNTSLLSGLISSFFGPLFPSPCVWRPPSGAPSAAPSRPQSGPPPPPSPRSRRPCARRRCRASSR